MKSLFLFVCFFSVTLTSFSGPGETIIAELNEKIDLLQYEFDSADGLADGKIELLPTANGERATALYLTLINKLQREINDKEQPWQRTRDELRILKNWLLETNSSRFGETLYLDKFEVTYHLHNRTKLDWVERTLENYPELAVRMYQQYKDEDFSYNVMMGAYERKPDYFLENLRVFRNEPAVMDLIDEMVKQNPIKMKRWVNTYTEMSFAMQRSNQPVTRLFLDIFEHYGRASKSFYLMNDIMNGTLTMNEADEISRDVSKFRQYLIELSTQKDIIAQEAVQDRLKEESLRVVRPINDQHENHNYAVRFKPADDLTAEELYSYMVYSQEEIFTSTFNGFYDRMMKKMEAEDTYEFLQSLNFNKYRTFLKMASGYNKLDDFLDHMSDEKQKQLLNQFVSNLEEGTNKESLTNAVDVADTFGSLTDNDLKAFFTQKMTDELARVRSLYNQHGIRIYSLLNVILAQNDNYSDEWITELVRQYDIPKINELEYKSLLNEDGKVIQQVFFYDDDDGKASYNSWIPSFRNGSWNIQDKKTFVKITSANKKVEILANKPQYEFEGKDDLKTYFRSRGESPSVVVHRGHSFYVDTTISYLTPQAKLVFLGSCGGYHSLTNVLDRAPDVHIISSKQIGTMAINDPLIRLMNKNLLKEDDIYWKDFWSTLEGQLKGNSTTISRFQDYVPPHENLGAIFLMAYNRLKSEQLN